MGKYDALQPIVDSQPRTPAPEPAAAPVRPTSQAKSRNSDYRQISVYIRRDLHNEAQRMLIGQDQDFSDVVNTLVDQWVRSIVPPGKKPDAKAGGSTGPARKEISDL